MGILLGALMILRFSGRVEIMFKKKKKIEVGRTIVGKHEDTLREEKISSERERVRKKVRMRTVLSVIGIMIIVVVMGFLVMIAGKNLRDYYYQKIAETEKELEEVLTPSVEIVDENGTNLISARIKEYVAMLEGDVKDLGYEVARVTLPKGKLREIDFYVVGVDWYFKGSIDRGSAETAEDTVRMIKYLKSKDIAPSSYVDVRVEGKGYYK